MKKLNPCRSVMYIIDAYSTMTSTFLSVDQLIPGQTYKVMPSRKFSHIHEGVGVYNGYTLNFTGNTPTVSGYSPDMKYFDAIKDGVVVDPSTVKVGDVITARSKYGSAKLMELFEVTRINYVYEFTEFTPLDPCHNCKISVYSDEANIVALA